MNTLIHTTALFITLAQTSTWDAFAWNSSEVGLFEAIDVLRSDVSDAAHVMAEAYGFYADTHKG
jgi:hypothetical protein